MAKAITFARFDAGIDTRKSATTSDANRMRDLLNCDITTGLTIRKRPGLKHVADLPDDSLGLFPIGTTIAVVTPESVGSPYAIQQVYAHVIAAGYLYVVLKTADTVGHYWLDNDDTDVLQSLELAQQAVDEARNLLSFSVAAGQASIAENAAIVTKVAAMRQAVAAIQAAGHDRRVAVDAFYDLLRAANQLMRNEWFTGYGVYAGDNGGAEDDYIAAQGALDSYDQCVSAGCDAHQLGLLDSAATAAVNQMLSNLTAVESMLNQHQVLMDALEHLREVENENATIGTLAGKVIDDANCPHTEQVVSLSGKLFAPSPDGATVRFSATNNPRDWSTADDAGFLPISHQGGGKVTALAVYRGMLAVFTDAHIQIWSIDPDPARHALVDITHGIGSDHPYSITSVSGDVLFWAYAGVRSLSQQSQTGNLSDVDIGSPVDELAAAMLARNPGKAILGHYSQALGKFLLFIGTEVLVYSFSRSAKLAAWSRWELPGEVAAVVDVLGVTYVRIGNAVLKFDTDLFTDDGVVFTVLADMAYMPLKSPGALKRVLGLDAAVQGVCDVSIACNERDESEEYPIGELAGDTRALGTVPVELTATAFAPRFRAEHDGEMQVDLLTFYYDTLGVR